MKKILILAAVYALSANSFAAIGLKPGLWEVSVKMTDKDGKQVDPHSQAAAIMKNLTPEQRSKITQMLNKTEGGELFKGVGKKGFQVCFTKKLLENPASLHQDPQKKCTTTVKNQTATKIDMTFKCKDGASGTGEWILNGDNAYTGQMHLTHKNGTKTDMTQEGKFVSAECNEKDSSQ